MCRATWLRSLAWTPALSRMLKTWNKAQVCFSLRPKGHLLLAPDNEGPPVQRAGLVRSK